MKFFNPDFLLDQFETLLEDNGIEVLPGDGDEKLIGVDQTHESRWFVTVPERDLERLNAETIFDEFIKGLMRGVVLGMEQAGVSQAVFLEPKEGKFLTSVVVRRGDLCFGYSYQYDSEGSLRFGFDAEFIPAPSARQVPTRRMFSDDYKILVNVDVPPGTDAKDIANTIRSELRKG